MQYKPFQDLQLSALGMGNMRLPTGEDGVIDEQKAREIIEHAYHSGINYFDTAYRYHGGQSESFVGKGARAVPAGQLAHCFQNAGAHDELRKRKAGFYGLPCRRDNRIHIPDL